MENKKIHQQFSHSFLCLEEEMKLQTEEIKEEKKNADTEIGILEEFFFFFSFLKFELSRFLDFEPKDLGCLNIKLLAKMEEHIFT